MTAHGARRDTSPPSVTEGSVLTLAPMVLPVLLAGLGHLMLAAADMVRHLLGPVCMATGSTR
jgi:hypothetical protein